MIPRRLCASIIILYIKYNALLESRFFFYFLVAGDKCVVVVQVIPYIVRKPRSRISKFRFLFEFRILRFFSGGGRGSGSFLKVIRLFSLPISCKIPLFHKPAITVRLTESGRLYNTTTLLRGDKI